MGEKAWAKEHKHEDLIALRDIIRKPENYIVNPKSGPQDLILIDHNKKEEERQEMKREAARMNISKDAKGTFRKLNLYRRYDSRNERGWVNKNW